MTRGSNSRLGPTDDEVIRRVRRAVHTLKGDSAACGYYQLSELAHELEDVLSPQIGQQAGGKLAEVVLEAADCFSAMLAAYQRNIEPPPAEPLRALIRSLLTAPAQPDKERSGAKSLARTSLGPNTSS